MDTLTDEQLVEQFLLGSEYGFEVLMQRYEAELYEYALKLTGEPLDAEAVVQEVFARAFTDLPRRPAHEPLKTWLFAAAISATLEMAQRRANDNAGLIADLEDLHAEISAREMTALELYAQPRRESLEAAVDHLPDDLWQVFYLVDQLGFSKSQAAQIVCSTVADVRERLYRARMELRHALDDGAPVVVSGKTARHAESLTSLLPM